MYMEDTNSCPAFIERREDDNSSQGGGGGITPGFVFPASAESPTISRLASRFESSILNSPVAIGGREGRGVVGISYDDSSTPPTPPRFSLFTPKKTPRSPSSTAFTPFSSSSSSHPSHLSASSSAVTNTPSSSTPYSCFLKKRCLYSPRRSSSVTSLPIRWGEEDTITNKILSASDDTFLVSPAAASRKRVLAQSTMDFSSLLAEENKARFLQDPSSPSPHDIDPIPCILPLLPHTPTDFNRIDGDTLVDLIGGKYKDVVEDFVIMDCRYNYEYEGGHINGAINMTPAQLFEYFNDIPAPVCNPHLKRKLVIVMHCEFSSVRAPKCIEILRSLDRTENFRRGFNWPLVSYPDVYLLQGGYKKFYETQKETCEPRAYVPEKSKEHKAKRQENKRARKQQLKNSSSGLRVSKKLVYYHPDDNEDQPPRKVARRCHSY